MNRHTVPRLLVAFVGVLLCLVGLLHAVVNVRGLQRAAARGEIAERLVPQMIVNVVFGGATLFMCGAILVLFAFGLRTPNRTLWSIGLLIGLFLLATGVAAYLWEPIPSVLVFSVLGALVCVPLLLLAYGLYEELTQLRLLSLPRGLLSSPKPMDTEKTIRAFGSDAQTPNQPLQPTASRRTAQLSHD
jgi:hypothetical protein